jgi:hypothetical protein
MPKGPFSPSQFIPTRWSTAEEKARFGNALLHFVDSGFTRNLFTDRLYGRLSNCFGHITHYNSTGFYEEWFSSLTAQVRFLEHTLRFPCYGDPAFTFSDVESEIQREIRNRNGLPRYQLLLAEEQRVAELTLLERLEGKYRSQWKDPEERPAPAPPPDGGEAVEPVQGFSSDPGLRRLRRPKSSFQR